MGRLGQPRLDVRGEADASDVLLKAEILPSINTGVGARVSLLIESLLYGVWCRRLKDRLIFDGWGAGVIKPLDDPSEAPCVFWNST